MSDLTRIPPEVWTAIITLACTDGGSTGRSLALTSHFVSGQSLSARFHTLSLTSLDQLECFLAFIPTQPDSFKLRVKHLFLSIVRPPHKPRHATLIGLSRQERDDLHKEFEERNRTWDDGVHAAMSSLLPLVSSTLRTFSLIIGPMANPRPPVPVDAFPVLEEFSMCGDISPFLKASPGEHHLSANPNYGWSRFPALRRLHYAGRGSSLAVTPTFTGGHPPPLLTHLRFSSLRLGDANLDLPRFDRIFGFPERTPIARASSFNQRPSPPRLKPTLPYLQHLVVHCFPPPPGGWCGTNDIAWGMQFSQLKALARKCKEETDVCVVAMDRPWRQLPNWKDRLHYDWLDRIGGGRGCWVHTVDEEAELEAYEDTTPSTPTS